MRSICTAIVIVVAVLVLGAGSVSATSLYTTSGHAALVSVGATANATATLPVVGTSATGVAIESCPHANLRLAVSASSGPRVVFSVVGSLFSSCLPYALSGTFAPPWKITVAGTGTVLGPSTRFAATIDSFAVDFSDFDGSFTASPLANGVTATQPTAGTAPICIDFAAAGPINGPVTGLTVDARFCLTGAPATAWSLT
jgi:hypothetical protein